MKNTRSLGSIINTAIALMAPMPTAAKIYEHLLTMMPHWIFAVAGATALELIGFSSMKLSARMRAFNRSHKTDEERSQFTAPSWEAHLMTAIYLVVAVVIIGLLELIDGLGAWVLIAFPFFGLVGGWFDGLQSDQLKRERARESIRKEQEEKKAESAAERKAARQAKKKEKEKLESAISKGKKPGKRKGKGKQQSGKVSDDQLLEAWVKDGYISDTDLGASLGVSRQAIGSRRRAMVDNRAIAMADDGKVIIGA